MNPFIDQRYRLILLTEDWLAVEDTKKSIPPWLSLRVVRLTGGQKGAKYLTLGWNTEQQRFSMGKGSEVFRTQYGEVLDLLKDAITYTQTCVHKNV
jgi:hypothetical protein